MQVPLPVDSELVVEWRALTIALLDRLAPLVRERLGMTQRDFPLGAMLEGGTWAAGRRSRAKSAPPARRRSPSSATARFFEEDMRHAWRHRRRSSAGAAQTDAAARQDALDESLPASCSTRSARCSVTRSRATCRSRQSRSRRRSRTMQSKMIAGKKLVLAPIVPRRQRLSRRHAQPRAVRARRAYRRSTATRARSSRWNISSRRPKISATGSFSFCIRCWRPGNSAVAAVDRLKEIGARAIRIVCVLATPGAVAIVREHHPDVHIWTAAIDERNYREWLYPARPRRRRRPHVRDSLK